MTVSTICGETDLLILGSGAGGLTAALAGALENLDCLVLEHAERIGGTSARSSGTVWVPDNHHMRRAGFPPDRAAAAAYLSALAGDDGGEALRSAFLDAAPVMLAELENRAGLRFRAFLAAPDYRQDKPGAAPGGRALEPPAFDGRLLGPDFARLAEPLPELTLFGGMMVTRAEASELVRADRSLRAARLALRLAARHLADRLRHPRGTRLVLGNALVAHLLFAAQRRGVEVRTGVSPSRLLTEGGRVVGVALEGGTIRARRAVVLAGGGFPSSARLREAHLPGPVARHTPAAPGCDGSTIEMALAAGAVLGPSGPDNALWFPSSLATRADGSTAVYPHIALDRAKPGSLAVDGQGRRFANEAVSYHEFVRAMYASGAVPAWLVCDRTFVARYGLGLIRPRTPFLGRYVRSGYLREGRSLAELAGRIGVPAAGLEDSVARFNAFARAGRDEDFGRGETIYERSNGDPAHAPNPCLGEIGRTPPFYAVALHPTPLGTSRGLLADASARVLDASGAPIAGLYVCGNDMHPAFGGQYPGAGAQLGQAMTFAWIAARHAAGQHP